MRQKQTSLLAKRAARASVVWAGLTLVIAGSARNDGKGEKDPCPSGYRVPTGSSKSDQGTWGDFNTSGNPYWKSSGTTAGSLFTKGAQSWYPASGYRHTNNGTLNNVATNGYSWSASSYSDSSLAWYFYFYSTGVNPAHANIRSHGFSVRCVQE